MSITPDPELEARLNELAEEQGISAEVLALTILREHVLGHESADLHDPWELRPAVVGAGCRTTPHDEDFTSEWQFG